MKKLLIVLSLLLAANFVFAEANFMGIPLGISMEEAEPNRKIYEEKIQKVFSNYFYSVNLKFFYTDNEPKQLYGFAIEFYSRGAECFGNLAKAYLLDNNFKLEGSLFYNEDIVIYLENDYIRVLERSKFNSAMKSLMK